MRHQALHDVLTGLPNRMLFARTAKQALQQTSAADGVAVLFCDLDRFKDVNDRLGHAAGDDLLRQVADRLRAVLRPGDTVGRLSGDEFALLLPQVHQVQAAETLAQRVIACFQDSFHLEGRELQVTTSVGVALHRGEHGRAESLLRAADAGMYLAKQRGRNQLAWAPPIAAPSQARPTPAVPSLEAELRSAVEHQQLRLHFQPLIHLHSNTPGQPGPPASAASQVAGGETRVVGAEARVVGAEALLRWQHPRLGLLAPVAFLPLADETGLSAELDLWALTAACQALAGWPSPPHARPLHIAVNLAGSTLLDPRLQPTVRAALASTGIAPERLYLEVVESRPLLDLPGVVERLTELRQLGVRISLDDFGTGYCTLSWLQRLPVDQLKIDRTFTAALPHDACSLAVVHGILALGRELGLEVVAEGVETPSSARRCVRPVAPCCRATCSAIRHRTPRWR